MSLIELCRFYDPEEALVAQSFLDAYGIAVFTSAYNHVSNAPHTRFGFGGMRLYICANEETDARKLLDQIQPIQHRCEACGSLYRPWRPRLLSAVVAIIFVWPFIHRRLATHCNTCKAELPKTAKPAIPVWLTNGILALVSAPYVALYLL